MAGADYIANPPSPPLALRPTAFPATANTAAWVSAAVSASSRDGSVNDVCSERGGGYALQQESDNDLSQIDNAHHLSSNDGEGRKLTRPQQQGHYYQQQQQQHSMKGWVEGGNGNNSNVNVYPSPSETQQQRGTREGWHDDARWQQQGSEFEEEHNNGARSQGVKQLEGVSGGGSCSASLNPSSSDCSGSASMSRHTNGEVGDNLEEDDDDLDWEIQSIDRKRRGLAPYHSHHQFDAALETSPSSSSSSVSKPPPDRQQQGAPIGGQRTEIAMNDSKMFSSRRSHHHNHNRHSDSQHHQGLDDYNEEEEEEGEDDGDYEDDDDDDEEEDVNGLGASQELGSEFDIVMNDADNFDEGDEEDGDDVYDDGGHQGGGLVLATGVAGGGNDLYAAVYGGKEGRLKGVKGGGKDGGTLKEGSAVHYDDSEEEEDERLKQEIREGLERRYIQTGQRSAPGLGQVVQGGGGGCGGGYGYGGGGSDTSSLTSTSTIDHQQQHYLSPGAPSSQSFDVSPPHGQHRKQYQQQQQQQQQPQQHQQQRRPASHKQQQHQKQQQSQTQRRSGTHRTHVGKSVSGVSSSFGRGFGGGAGGGKLKGGRHRGGDKLPRGGAAPSSMPQPRVAGGGGGGAEGSGQRSGGVAGHQGQQEQRDSQRRSHQQTGGGGGAGGGSGPRQGESQHQQQRPQHQQQQHQQQQQLQYQPQRFTSSGSLVVSTVGGSSRGSNSSPGSARSGASAWTVLSSPRSPTNVMFGHQPPPSIVPPLNIKKIAIALHSPRREQVQTSLSRGGLHSGWDQHNHQSSVLAQSSSLGHAPHQQHNSGGGPPRSMSSGDLRLPNPRSAFENRSTSTELVMSADVITMPSPKSAFKKQNSPETSSGCDEELRHQVESSDGKRANREGDEATGVEDIESSKSDDPTPTGENPAS